MAQTSTNLDRLIELFDEKPNFSRNSSEHDEWMKNSISFRQISSEIEKKLVSTSNREIKLFSKEQFRSHINRLYPFHLDFFSDKLSSLDFEQHQMGLYIFYDINRQVLINDFEKETKKKTQRGKNMKRMNGLLLNEHRMFNECAKQYAIKHFQRDYQSMKTSIQQFVDFWLKRKTNRLRNSSPFIERFYSTQMTIPLNSYDSLTPVNFVNLSTILRLGTIPQLTIPEKIDDINVKCSDNHDRIVSNRFNSDFRLTNLVDDPNILAILSEDSSIDVVLSKKSFELLIELFSDSTTPMSLPISIREFQYENVEDPTNPLKKKILFIDKPFRQRFYTKRELNRKFFQRSFRSLLLSQTGGKRETTNNPFHFIGFTDKVDYSITEIRKKFKKIVEEEKPSVKNEIQEEDEDDDDDEDEGMIISTDGDNEEQQKLFQKSKQKIIQSARTTTMTNQTTDENETLDETRIPIVDRVKLVTPVQGNYEYSIWQLGSLKILLRTSFHGFSKENEFLCCFTKLEYQPQFGLEQITDKEYRSMWFNSYLRRGSKILIGRINAFTQQLLKIEQFTYENIEENLKECQIDMLKLITKVYGLLYGLQVLEPKNYLLKSPLNENKVFLYQPTTNDSTESEGKFRLDFDPIESNDLLVESDQTTVPWVPLTPTLLLRFHLDFERIPLTFCPRNKRLYDISLTIPTHRKRRSNPIDDQTTNLEKKKRKKAKKKRNQMRKKINTEQSTC